jgi:hypothetical protein
VWFGRYNLVLRLAKIMKTALSAGKNTPAFVENVLSLMERFQMVGE